MATITLLTDFGLEDAYVGVMHGVIRGIAPTAGVIDLCHNVPRQDIPAGAFLLLTSYRYFPVGAIFVAVVDPGVGTDRKIVAARAGGYTFIGPDNGLLKWAVDDAGGAEALVAVENPAMRLPGVGRTFHGRDVMAPAAAHLANSVPLERFGPPLAALSGEPFEPETRVEGGKQGQVIYVDRYGNCITNLTAPAGDVGGRVRAAGRWIEIHDAYRKAAPGQPLALAGSAGFLEIAVRDGSAAQQLGLQRGATVIVEVN